MKLQYQLLGLAVITLFVALALRPVYCFADNLVTSCLETIFCKVVIPA